MDARTRTERWLLLDGTEDDPFGLLDAFLAEHGFGVWNEPFVPAADGLVADLHIGYRLAASLPGVTVPQPPDPCPLPALACHVRPAEGDRRGVPGRFAVGPFDRTWTEAEHRRAVCAVREAIARGDVYQANVVQHLQAPFSGDPAAVAGALSALGAEHQAAMHGDGWSIVSATPELFLRRRGDVVETMPIKGTRPAASTERIADSPKDRAEHVMIVDLERNDLARVCVPHSVHVPEYLVERPMAGVRHLVSRVQGRLSLAVGLAELLRATFPGGSVTGAPKVSAVNHIARLEPVGRGASMGALGRVYPKADWAPRVFRAKTTFESIARDLVEGYFHGVSRLPDRQRDQLFSDGFQRDLQGYRAIDVMRAHAKEAPTDDPLSLIQYLDFKTWLPGDILTKVDRASMAHSLEVRVPLLDHEFCEYAATLPPSLKLRGGEGKYILKKALEPHLPHDIMYRSKKGFSIPLAAWLRGPLRDAVKEAVLGKRLEETGIFNRRYLEQLVSQHHAGSADHSVALWSLMMFDAFLRVSAGA